MVNGEKIAHGVIYLLIAIGGYYFMQWHKKGYKKSQKKFWKKYVK